ncbi:ectoine hydrolase DoeA [Pelagivirga sediminicola]|uniref:Ectoine hydrolase DoeA n=1 Tax=Pelagivirga sediminicola TaxID=2170575 RepID=A0A2T7G8T6_9RHOB|nr:M24 family metallopeptidase [Pelagivirga sediminicola]PVA10811.1 ectoine hydrolase DoeA [Pelagivirga sediminicola]
MIEKDIPFSTAEYQRRLVKTRRAMEAANIDVMFCTDPSNQNWLTAYDGWSFYVHQGVLVFPDADPAWWGRRMDANGGVRTVWMEDARVWSYDDKYVQSTERHPMEDLARRLKDLGLGSARIGVEMDNYYFSAKAYQVLTAEMPDATFVDATALVNWQRAVKSDEEIAFMRKAASITDKIIEGLRERVEPGIPKNEVVAEILRDAVRGVPGAWGDYPAILPLLPSGSEAGAPHLTWNGRPFTKGEATFFEVSGVYRRYHAPCCRTLMLGTPSDEMKRASDALVEGLNAGIEAARPGARAADIANALNGALEKAGIERGARCGYPVGLSYPPDWGERTISLRASDDTVLEPGMTFHFMPGLWMDTWGMETTETILIAEDGPAETLCNQPRELFVKG